MVVVCCRGEGEGMTGNDMAVGVYVHVPFCVRKCPYCDFYSVPVGGQDVAGLVAAELRELGRYALAGDVGTVYVGGGVRVVCQGGSWSGCWVGYRGRWARWASGR